MNTESILTLIIAAIGAVTGSLALLLQWFEHRSDRALIELKGSLSISANIQDPVERYELRLDVVNKGRRIARIAEVYIETSTQVPTTRWVLFDSKGENPIALEEGQTKRFKDRIMTATFDGFFESLGEEEYFVVRLSTGELHHTKFWVSKKSELAALRNKRT